MPQLARQSLEEFFRNGRQTLEAELRDGAKRELDNLRRELLSTFEERQRHFEKAHAAATAQLQQLEKRTDELTALVDLELQAHVEESVREGVGQITKEVQEACAKVSDSHLTNARAELDRSLGPLLRRAEESQAELRHRLE
jgi:membrane carboxypeptidase/penicillin-binding protein PbpC